MRNFTYIGLLIFLLSMPGSQVFAQSKTLIPFSLQDQFDKTYTQDYYHGYYVILVGGDRKGSEYCFIWSDTIKNRLDKESLDERTKVLGIADLETAPSALKKLIKSKFPREKEHGVMLDWNGTFDQAYNFTEDQANIIVFAPDGRQIYRTSATDIDQARMNSILASILRRAT